MWLRCGPSTWTTNPKRALRVREDYQPSVAAPHPRQELLPGSYGHFSAVAVHEMSPPRKPRKLRKPRKAAGGLFEACYSSNKVGRNLFFYFRLPRKPDQRTVDGTLGLRTWPGPPGFGLGPRPCPKGPRPKITFSSWPQMHNLSLITSLLTEQKRNSLMRSFRFVWLRTCRPYIRA